jgi:hypothetical protein
LRRRLRQSTTADVDLQGRMQQLGLIEAGIALSTLFQESFLGQAVLQVAVALPLLRNTHERHRLLAISRRVVVASPDLDVARQAEQLAGGLPERFGAAAGEVAACYAEVGVEDGVAAEYVVCLVALECTVQRTAGSCYFLHSPPIRYPTWSGVWPGRWTTFASRSPI